MMTSIANVKQLRTDGSFRILLPFFRTSWGFGVLNSAIFNSFHNRVEFGTILESLLNFGAPEFEHLNPPPVGTPLTVCICLLELLVFFLSAHERWPIITGFKNFLFPPTLNFIFVLLLLSKVTSVLITVPALSNRWTSNVNTRTQNIELSV